MTVSDISLLGWLHTLACLIALPAGAWALMARKGGQYHRFAGWCYAAAMLVQALPVLAIYRFDIVPGQKPGPGHFGFFHWSTLAILVAVTLAIIGASRQRQSRSWAHIHAQAMLFSYYLLAGGLLNELLARVTPLRQLALSLSPHAGTTVNTLLAQLLQTAAMLAWWGLIPLFAAQVARRFAAPRGATIGYPMRYSGGAFVAWLGIACLFGAFWRHGSQLGLAIALGMVSGAFVLWRVRRAAVAIWGPPTRQQTSVLILAVGAEMLAFLLLGLFGLFQRMPPVLASQTAFGIVAAHFLVMRWSHGPLMLRLGLANLAWLAVAMVLGLPVPLLAIGDALIKLGFGLAMVEPLLTAPSRRQMMATAQ